MLEVANSQKASYIIELKQELNVLKNRLTKLELEQKHLENSNSNQFEESFQQIKTLEKALNDAKAEKSRLTESFNETQEMLMKKHREDIQKMNLENSIKIDQLTSEYEIKITNEKNNSKEKILNLEKVSSNKDYHAIFKGHLNF